MDKEGGHEKIGQKYEGLIERGGRVPNCFIIFPSEKHVFITIGILFLSGEYSHLLESIDLVFHVVYVLLENDILSDFFSSYSYFQI